MKQLNKEQMHGVVGTAIVHIILLLILLFVVIDKPIPKEEQGVPVVLGNVERSKGDAYTYTEVKVAPQPAPKPVQPKPVKSPVDPLITQTTEETVALNSGEKKKQETKKPEKTPEQLEAERKALEEERKRQEAEKMAREANAKIAGAFGKGTTMTDKGESEEGKGNEGSVEGNENTGVTKGVGGYGSFDLQGRDLGKGGLPRPEYSVQEEGRVVVNITVNPNGNVVGVSINRRTNTTSKSLRDAAMKAARKAVFNSVSTVDNQMGTITYYFTLK